MTTVVTRTLDELTGDDIRWLSVPVADTPIDLPPDRSVISLIHRRALESDAASADHPLRISVTKISYETESPLFAVFTLRYGEHELIFNCLAKEETWSDALEAAHDILQERVEFVPAE